MQHQQNDNNEDKDNEDATAVTMRGLSQSKYLCKQRQHLPSWIGLALIDWLAEPKNIGLRVRSKNVVVFQRSDDGDYVATVKQERDTATAWPTLVLCVDGESLSNDRTIDRVSAVFRDVASGTLYEQLRITAAENVLACKMRGIWPSRKQDAERSAALFATLTNVLPVSIADRIAQYSLLLRSPLAVDFLRSRRKRRSIMTLDVQYHVRIPLALPSTLEPLQGGAIFGLFNVAVGLDASIETGCGSMPPTLAYTSIQEQETSEFARNECWFQRARQLSLDTAVPGARHSITLAWRHLMPTIALLLHAKSHRAAHQLSMCTGELRVGSKFNVLLRCSPMAARREAQRIDCGLSHRWFALPLCDLTVDWNALPSRDFKTFDLRRQLGFCQMNGTACRIDYVGAVPAAWTDSFSLANFDVFALQCEAYVSTASTNGLLFC